MSNRPPNYLAFLYGKLSSPIGKPIEDGKLLGRQCVEQLRALEDREHFPPALLILLASPAYLEQSKAAQLVAGVHHAFADEDYHNVPLIGSTVAAVFFDQRVYSEGALLVCLASRLVEADIAIGVEARNSPEMAINDVLKQLDLTPGGKADPNPFADLTMLTFLPGFGDDGLAAGFPAPELHRLLREGIKGRIRIAGGVSSANDPARSKSGLQFADRLVLKDAIVTARISSGTPLVATFGHGLSHTGEPLQVTKLSTDKRTVHEFDGRPAAEVIREKGKYVMLGEMSASSELVIDVPREATDGNSVELMRKVKDGAFFEILMPEPAEIQAAVEKELVGARERVPIANPLPCLMLPCNAWRLRDKNIDLEIERLLSKTEERLGITTVGGFVDGEMGVDETARSVFGNGGVAGLIFGDEIRSRSLSHRVLGALVKNGKEMTGASDIEEAIGKALEIVVETGFPGAKLWLVQHNREEEFVVAKDWRGKRFKKTEGSLPRPLMAHNILAIAARERKPFFIKDSSQDPRCNQEAVRDSGIISQYIVPLLRLDGEALGVLQVDLGDLSYIGELPTSMKDVLDSFGSIFGATFARISNHTEAEILSLLDEEFNQSLSARTLEEGMQTLIEKTLKAFGLEIGYVRLADYERRTLTLIAGVGPSYPAVMKDRREVLFDDTSPLSRAFLEGKVTTVNDANRDPVHKQMIKRSEEQYPEIAKDMKGIGSFTAVALESEAGGKLGVLGLYSNQPWFFTPPRIRAMMSLGKHLGLIVEHFEQRRAEEQVSRLLQFRSEIFRSKRWYQPVMEHNLDSLPKLLSEIVSRFRSAIGAETASLYLLDEATRAKLILRAEDGWITNQADIASYRIREGWTGSLMMSDRVDYVPDMRDRKKKTDQAPHGRYAVQMFGAEIPDTLTVESIGLPLKIGDKRLGVLSLHRRVRIEDMDKGSGFEITDPDLLQEGANALSVYVDTLLSQKLALWEKEEQKLWEEILSVFAESLDEEALAEKLCQQILESLGASQVNFYEHSEEKGGDSYQRIASKSLPSYVETTDREIGDELIHLAGSPPRRVQVQWTNAPNQQGAAAPSELVVRICIPLEATGSSTDVDVIDIHWERTVGAEPMLIRDKFRHLKALGNRIGSDYHRNKLISERKAARQEILLKQSAVQAMGLMLAQSGHRVINLIQSLKHLPPLLIEARHDENLFNERIARMEERLKTGTAMIERPLKLGKSMVRVTPNRCNVSDIVRQAIDLTDLQPDLLVVDGRVSPAIFVLADEDQIREAIYNLVDNAIKASPAGGVLTIEADAIERDKIVRILIADTGHGMTESEIEAAKSGFISTRGHTGLGLLISSLLIQANNGNIDITSVKGAGTRITITLPLASKEKAHGVESLGSGR